MATSVVRFTVNGQRAEVNAESNTPLLYALRNDLQLTGARFGCGAGACGSCTVLLDRRAVNSCDTPLWAVEGHEVRTLEGLGTPEHPHPVQQAFVELQAAQCGYCIGGIMVSVTALREQASPPTEGALQTALARHLCRCGAHLRILKAARRAVGLPEPTP